jgi:hypothetical protein
LFDREKLLASAKGGIMKLAEALIERKSVKQKIESLRERLQENALVQEGDRPAEAPEQLLAALREAISRLKELIRSISATNASADIGDHLKLADAIVQRDMLKLEHHALEQLVSAATIRQQRFSQNEVKFVRIIDHVALRDQIDELAKQWRTLDARIQAANWSTDLREVD